MPFGPSCERPPDNAHTSIGERLSMMQQQVWAWCAPPPAPRVGEAAGCIVAAAAASPRRSSSAAGERRCHLPAAQRRDALVVLGFVPAGLCLTQQQQMPAALAAAAPVAQQQPPCRASLDASLAASLLQAVYKTVVQQQILPEDQLQRERFKLQQREYPYYAAAHPQLPKLPDLSDNSGGLSDRAYFGFCSYVLWKAVAQHLPTPEQRTHFNTGVGEQLLQQLAPDTAARLRQAAAAAGGAAGGAVAGLAVAQQQQAPAGVMLQSILDVLVMLQQGGYLCGWQLVWGSQPGSWPGDWTSREPQVVDADDVLQQQLLPLPPGSVFQIKAQTADIEAAVALRSEEDGFWSRIVSSLLVAMFRAGGYDGAVADEYFVQDVWQGPSSVADKLLLLLGDPLEEVGIDFAPSTLIQNWTVA